MNKIFLPTLAFLLIISLSMNFHSIQVNEDRTELKKEIIELKLKQQMTNSMAKTTLYEDTIQTKLNELLLK